MSRRACHTGYGNGSQVNSDGEKEKIGERAGLTATIHQSKAVSA